MNKFIKFGSFVTHPIWIPTWLLVFWLWCITKGQLKWGSSDFHTLLIYQFCFTALIPGIIFYTTQKGKKMDWEMRDVRRRFWPFFLSGILWLTHALSMAQQLGNSAQTLVEVSASGGITLLTLSLFYHQGKKISAHSSGWASLGTLLLFAPWISPSIFETTLSIISLLLGIVFGLRWYGQAHTGEELSLGIILGIIQAIFVHQSFELL
jgi:hypothetical protein